MTPQLRRGTSQCTALDTRAERTDLMRYIVLKPNYSTRQQSSRAQPTKRCRGDAEPIRGAHVSQYIGDARYLL